jgi:hypothetical protein
MKRQINDSRETVRMDARRREDSREVDARDTVRMDARRREDRFLDRVRMMVERSRQFLAHRGHMVSFLMMVLMVTAWVNVFQESVNAAVISTFM